MNRLPLDQAGLKLKRCHKDMLDLCRELEAIADSLPDAVDRQQCLQVARSVCRTVADAQKVEETMLFPALERLSSTLTTMPATLERLRFEHYEDMCFAEELQETLLALGRGDRGLSPEAIGYMLRGFFESVRRHVAFERELLTPLLAMSWTTSPARSPSA
ncbi:hemerythrin domain-containing protein [Tianweitania sediminis]|jgi:hemerythrin-like domain-containing protein|uniref:Hemerythrin domain-containing protein n=1 Tax=Tianweitania sediminis TaxID=1502156 RepID=A0A8J7UHX6_9HYPH|nr:hemerythrin domain-containing protein [Tianweitania sediminis]MBP0437175.1 hemerythrin domain-containing protein [Tianweitania sediminis]HEV7416891.1 hemerythrin domain-containing protein [Tianweitania sediminis]